MNTKTSEVRKNANNALVKRKIVVPQARHDVHSPPAVRRAASLPADKRASDQKHTYAPFVINSMQRALLATAVLHLTGSTRKLVP
jgi:hypothetical protein